MTTLVRIAIAFLIALFLGSCGFDIKVSDFGPGEKGNGTIIEENRPITGEFKEISAQEGIDVYVTQADDFAITVEADENIVDLIGTDIKNGKLRVHAIENIGRATKKVYVSLPEITELTASSGAGLRSETPLTVQDLDIDMSSGANVRLEVAADHLNLDASSGANANLSGKAVQAEFDVSSGANVNAVKLNAQQCRAEASSGANMSIHVDQSLTADASSGGNISYAGNPSVSKKKSVSGSVTKY
ncbi:MAG: head GIN domain-containing protein [Flavobacteriaceae bacterium]